MIVILPQADAEDICNAIRAKGYAFETLTAERAAANLDQFMEAPLIAAMTAPAYKQATEIEARDIAPELTHKSAPAYKQATEIEARDIAPNLTFRMEVN